MTSSFAEIQFPPDISYGSSGGPVYSTDIVETFNGHEQRNINWQLPRAKYNVAHGVKKQAQMEALIEFFHARRGRAIGFRFKDWLDYKANNQQIGTGDDATTEFQLVKTYSNAGQEIIRNISKPVDNDEFKIFLDSIEQTNGYSVDYVTGIVNFDTPPNNGAIITANFEFDVPVRFDTDSLDASIDDFGTRSWSDIPLIELRL